jgi:hypothetical protein
MATEDQILLKLIIKGMDPAEIMALAQSTQGDLNLRIAQYLDKLVNLHRAANEATTKLAKQSAQDQIKEVEKQIDVINKVARAQELAANRANASFRGMMEHLENLTIVATGAWNAISGGVGRLKELGDSVDRVTNIYSSLRGSIDEMREASAGEIADIDLITTKNRAFEKDLHLTDQQFGMVAAAADKFADALGVNTKEALDKLIDGLATGKMKMLEHAGIVVDADQAYKDYARSIGTTADKLSDTGKHTAIAEAALKSMDKKLAESGGVANDFSHQWEKTMSTLSNQWDQFLLHLGQGVITFEKSLTIALPNTLKIAIAKFKDTIAGFTGGDTTHEAFARVQFGKELEEFDKPNTRQQEAAKARLAAGDDAYKIADREKDRAIATVKPKRDTGYYPFGKGATSGHGQAENKADAERFGYDKTPEEFQADFEKKNMTGDNADYIDEGAMDRAVESFKTHQAAIEEVVKAAGGPAFARILFGENGPQETLDQMDEFERASVEGMNQIAEAAQRMAMAVGASIAASISGSNQHKKSVKQATHDVLEGLAAQAIGYALMQAAMGVADLAMYHYDAAVLHFKSAAMFAAIGVVSGLGARGVGEDASSSGGAGSKGTSSANGGGFNTPRSNGSSDTGTNKQPITVNLSVWPGGEAEAGRQVAKALGAYTRESGQSIVDLTTGKAAA